MTPPGERLSGLPFAVTCINNPTPNASSTALEFVYQIPQGATSYDLAFYGQFEQLNPATQIPELELLEIERPSGQSLRLSTGALDYAEDISVLVQGLPALGVTIPSNPTKRAQLEAGAHKAIFATNARRVCAYRIVEFAPGERLDFNVHFVGDVITADSAFSSPQFTQMMQTLQTRLTAIGMSVGKVRLYDASADIAQRYAAPNEGQLFSLAREVTAVPGMEPDDALSLNVIVVPRFAPGLPYLGLSLGINAPVGLHGGPMSATILSAEYLASGGQDINGQPWSGGEYVGTTLVHELGHFMGLHHTSEAALPFDQFDPLVDTPQCSRAQLQTADYISCPDVTNVMFPYVVPPLADVHLASDPGARDEHADQEARIDMILFLPHKRATLALLLLATVALFAAPSPLWAEPDREEQAEHKDELAQARTSVGRLLAGYHHVPSREQLERATPLAREALELFVKDDKLLKLYRRRALLVLGQGYVDDQAASLCDVLIQGEEEALVGEALYVLLTYHGEAGQRRVTEALLSSPYSSHRQLAALTLRALPKEQRAELFARALELEQDPQVRAALVSDTP